LVAIPKIKYGGLLLLLKIRMIVEVAANNNQRLTNFSVNNFFSVPEGVSCIALEK